MKKKTFSKASKFVNLRVYFTYLAIKLRSLEQIVIIILGSVCSTCDKCDHRPPPSICYNYSTADGDMDSNSKTATYETVSFFVILFLCIES